MIEILIAIAFLIGAIASMITLAVILPFPSPEEQKEMGVDLRRAHDYA